MSNLKQFDLNKLDALPKRQSMHCQYATPFSKMDSMWDTKREYHGDSTLHRAVRIFAGSLGKSKSYIRQRLKLFWPKQWHQTVDEFIAREIDYHTKLVDGVLLFTARYRYADKDNLTLEEINDENNQRIVKSYRWRIRTGGEYYFDANNILCQTRTFRKAKPKQTRKEYFEKVQAKRKAKRDAILNERAVADISSMFINKQEYLQAYQIICNKYWKNIEKAEEYKKRETKNGIWARLYKRWAKDAISDSEDAWDSLTAISRGDMTPLDDAIAKRKKESELNYARVEARQQKQRELGLV